MTDISFTFWNSLSSNLYEIDRRDLEELFEPYIKRLIHQLWSLCQLDPAHVSLAQVYSVYYYHLITC